MKTYHLTRERKARLWLNEFSESGNNIEMGQKISRKASCIGEEKLVRNSVAIELFVPLGGRFLYGMLGGVGAGAKSRGTTLEIAKELTIEKHESVEDSLSGQLDQVRPWVSENYCSSVLAGASAAVEKYDFFFSEFCFNRGRQGDIGSSMNFFHLLGFVVVSLLSVPEEHIEDYLNSLDLEMI